MTWARMFPILARPSQRTELSRCTLVLTSGRRNTDSVVCPGCCGSADSGNGPNFEVSCGATVKSELAGKVLPIRVTPVSMKRLKLPALTEPFGLLAGVVRLKEGAIRAVALEAAWVVRTVIVQPRLGRGAGTTALPIVPKPGWQDVLGSSM